jgi:DNA-binding NarL/FixJ family response regulator
MTITVVLADDQALVRRGFRLILETEPDIEVVAEAEDGQQAIDAVRRHRPAVVLMDIQMPGLDGLEATRRILGDAGNQTRVLILTTFERDDYVFEALQVGASGFLLKTAPPEDLLTAVRVVARGEALLSPSVTRRVIQEVTRHQRRAPRARRTWTASPSGSWRCCGCWPRACPTPRSPPSSTSARRPSRPTPPVSCPS